MINIMSPITTSNKTITRKSVFMVAELGNGTALWTVGGIGQRLEDNSVITKVLHVIALKITSEFGSYAVVDWTQWPGMPILAGGTAAVRMPGRLMGLQSREQPIQLHEDQLTTDTADLKMTKDALAEDTAKTQRKIAWKPKQKSRISRPTTGVCLRKGACEGRDLRAARQRGIPGEPVSAVIARRFGWRIYQKRESDRIGADSISC